MIRKLRNIIERMTGTRIYRNFPRGIDVFEDIVKSLPDYRIKIIFDVGANVGQSALQYARIFPDASIYSFEPVSKSFKSLVKASKGSKNIKCFQIALSSSSGKGVISAEGTSTMNHLLDNNENHISVEEVDLTSIDDFCENNSITHISYLKVDTEGADLDVLKGSVAMLNKQSIDFLELEASTNPNNTYHVPLEEIKSYMEEYNYFLFGFYDQASEWPTKEVNLRRVNPVFVSSQMIAQHKG